MTGSWRRFCRYRLHPLGTNVVAGLLVHPFERAREMLEFYRQCTAALPDDHTIFATLTHAPDGSGIGYNFLVLAQWLDAAGTDANINWARESYARMGQFVGGGRDVNYLDDDEASDAVDAAYGANYPRLRALKTKYDPHNFFRLNQNILPLS